MNKNNENIMNKNMNEIECKVVVHGNIETKSWFKNGKLHKDDGPAIISTTGAKYWYQNGILHRLDGPAVICPVGSQYWYKHGLLHREDGPAVKTDTYEEWYINGKNIELMVLHIKDLLIIVLKSIGI